MKFILNLWLERKDPCLEVVTAEHGDLVMRWEKEDIEHRLFSGEMCFDDLNNTRLSFIERLGLDTDHR